MLTQDVGSQFTDVLQSPEKIWRYGSDQLDAGCMFPLTEGCQKQKIIGLPDLRKFREL